MNTKLNSLLILVLIIFSNTLYAQNNPRFVFCEIGVTENYNFLKNSPFVYFDFGSKEVTAAIVKTMKDPKTDKTIAFRSPTDALNYMAKREWEFVQAYLTPGVSNQTVIHYIMKKPYDDLDDETKSAFEK